MIEAIVVLVLVSFVSGVGVGSLLLGVRFAAIVKGVVEHTHQEYAAVETKTKEFIAAGVTRLEEIKKAL